MCGVPEGLVVVLEVLDEAGKREWHLDHPRSGELVVIADMVKVVDVADPDGNEVSFVQDLTAE